MCIAQYDKLIQRVLQHIEIIEIKRKHKRVVYYKKLNLKY